MSSYSGSIRIDRLDQFLEENRRSQTSLNTTKNSSAASPSQLESQTSNLNFPSSKGEEPFPYSGNEDLKLQEGELFEKVPRLSKLLDELGKAIEAIEGLYKQALITVNHEKTAKIHSNIQYSTQSINGLIMKVRDGLIDLRQQKSQNNNDKSTACSRAIVVKVHHKRLAQRLLGAIHRWEQAQCTYRSKQRAQLKRQYLLVRPEADAAELDQLFHPRHNQNVGLEGASAASLPPADIQEVIHRHMLFGERVIAEEQLDLMRDRQVEIQALETSIQELHGMFLDVSVMVQEQGSQIDRLESYLGQTEAYTKAAAQTMQKSLLTNKRKQTYKRWVALIVLILLLILIAVLWSNFVKPVTDFLAAIGKFFRWLFGLS